ncbi:hypothetical protein PLESTB_001161700 [Pleodorina starrii]|uniref:NYN domain-containing protein n=1 Tax=Pleodorina starrii TaxID=330485 RepID=A0A9W6BRP5_9CHLO|nr:hypothetical protein PLESTB_001161700 [Pleodorina starrii]GLC64740.1 hypothetical protein PLESTF_000202400 [Pleodorina starrii]
MDLQGAAPEQGDATSSRLRARPARDPTRDLLQQDQSENAAAQKIFDVNLPNAVPEPAVSPVGLAGEAPQSAAAPSQQVESPELRQQPSDDAAQTGTSGTQPPVTATDGPEPHSQQQQQQQEPRAAATAIASAVPDLQAIQDAELEQLLARVSVAPPPVVDGRKLVLIAWDIEAIRCPEGASSGSKQPWKHPMSPQNVLGYLKQHFIYSQGRMEYRSVAALSENCLRNILKFHEQFVELAVPNLSLLLASKGATGAVLEKEMRGFMAEHAHIARQSPGQLTIALIARDDHFSDIKQEASDAGFCVEVLSQRVWVDFLRRSSGQRTVRLVK